MGGSLSARVAGGRGDESSFSSSRSNIISTYHMSVNTYYETECREYSPSSIDRGATPLPLVWGGSSGLGTSSTEAPSANVTLRLPLLFGLVSFPSGVGGSCGRARFGGGLFATVCLLGGKGGGDLDWDC